MMLARQFRRTAATLARTSKRSFSAVASASDYPPYILSAPATEVTELSSGLRVASEGGHGETATIGVWIDAGSRYETESNNGVAHFLEHMAFKGTNKRSRQQLEVEIENMGAHLNAYTSREQTVYYAKCLKKDIPQAMDILSDILLNATLDESAIEAERSVILREMEEVQKQTEEVVFDSLHETAFSESGLGYTILGPKKNINSLTRKDLDDYIKTHYTAKRMVIAGAGAVDHDELCGLADKYFGSVPTVPPAGYVVPEDNSRFIGSDIRFREDNMGEAHVALAFESAGWTDKNHYPLILMNTMLGNWDRASPGGKNMSSGLAQAAANDDLCTRFYSFQTFYQDTGLFGVYAVMQPNTVQDMMWHTMDQMVSLCHNVTEDMVDRAKTKAKASQLMQLDGSTAICEDIGRQMLTFGRRMSPAEVFARINAVNAEAVMDCAGTFINDQDIAFAGIGNLHELPDYNWMRRRTYWNRF